MTPYWQSADGRQVLYHGDCREVLPTLHSESIGAVITDPPFGTRRPSARRLAEDRFREIEGNASVEAGWFSEAFRIVADGGCCYSFCTWDTLGQWRSGAIAGGWRVRSCIVWDKEIHGLADLVTCWAPQHELILFAAKGRHELRGRRPVDVIRHKRLNADALEHPYQKPVPLIVEIMRTNAGIVVDPFAGAGTTGVACIKAGRQFVGIEIDERYCEISVRRMEEAISQPKLPFLALRQVSTEPLPFA